MSPARHCDEIIRLIDGALGELVEPPDPILSSGPHIPLVPGQGDQTPVEAPGARGPRLTALHSRNRERLLRKQGLNAVSADP